MSGRVIGPLHSNNSLICCAIGTSPFPAAESAGDFVCMRSDWCAIPRSGPAGEYPLAAFRIACAACSNRSAIPRKCSACFRSSSGVAGMSPDRTRCAYGNQVSRVTDAYAASTALQVSPYAPRPAASAPASNAARSKVSVRWSIFLRLFDHSAHAASRSAGRGWSPPVDSATTRWAATLGSS